MKYKIEIIAYKTCFTHNLLGKKWILGKWKLIDRQRSNDIYNETARQWASVHFIPDKRIKIKFHWL